MSRSSGDGVLEPPPGAIAFGTIREGDCKDATREAIAKMPSGRAIATCCDVLLFGFQPSFDCLNRGSKKRGRGRGRGCWITCFEFRQKATEISDERIIIAFEAGKPHTQSVSEFKCKHLPNPAMPQDYSGQNLRGRSFKGQDLTGNLFWQNSQPGLVLPKVSLEFSKTG